jgi:P-type Cu+ transporter
LQKIRPVLKPRGDEKERAAMTKGKRQATAILHIQGMNRSGRANRLRRSAAKLNGVSLVDINYILDNVTIGYDPDKLTLAQIKRKVEPSTRTRV